MASSLLDTLLLTDVRLMEEALRELEDNDDEWAEVIIEFPSERVNRIEQMIAKDDFMGIVDFIVPKRTDRESVCTECFLIKPNHLVSDSVCVDCV